MSQETIPAKVSAKKVANVVLMEWRDSERPVTRKTIARRLNVRVTPWLLDKIEEALDNEWITGEQFSLPNGLPVWAYTPRITRYR